MNRGVTKQRSLHRVIQVISNILEAKFVSNVHRIVKNVMDIPKMTAHNAIMSFILTMEVACLSVNQVMKLIKMKYVKVSIFII